MTISSSERKRIFGWFLFFMGGLSIFPWALGFMRDSGLSEKNWALIGVLIVLGGAYLFKT